MLLGLLVLPAVVVAYVWMLGRERRYAVTYSDLQLIRSAIGSTSRWRRHMVPLLVFAALGSLIFGLARPRLPLPVAQGSTSIILALDVSRSMCATDIEPNRLTIAQQAATEFITSQAPKTPIGLVAFAGFAELVVAPTQDADVLIEAVEGFRTSFGTAIGSATMRSVDAIADLNGDVTPTGVELGSSAARAENGAEIEPVPDIVVLLTDGANSNGIDPIAAAEQAADRGVRVYTIGFGTSNPTEMVCAPTQAGVDFIVDPFGSQSVTGIDPAGDFGQSSAFGGFRQFLVIDEPTLQGIAELTGGGYFKAEDAEQLAGVFGDLPSRVERQTKEVEVSVAFVILGAALTLLAIATALGRSRLR